MPICKLTGFPGFDARGLIVDNKEKSFGSLTITIGTPERLEEIRSIFGRALNTMDRAKMPEWAMDFSDMMDALSGKTPKD